MPKKFLIGQLACYGDCLYATTIAKQIKFDYPNSHVTWAIASKYKSILELNPHIDSIWELNLVDGDYYEKGWQSFEKEARIRKKNGDFDEIIFSQIYPLNWIDFYKTIRGTILSTYKRGIKETVTPVLRLSAAEIENVKLFAAKNYLHQYKSIILFECNPGSGQSKITTEFAIGIAKNIVECNNEVCFILTTPNKINLNHAQIIDASELTYRENAELTKYCSLLIGCSSGITWLSTSDWARRIPMLQLLDSKSLIFSGVHFDFEVNGLDNSMIIEMTEYNSNTLCKCIKALITEDFLAVKNIYHQSYKPNSEHLYMLTKDLIHRKYRIPSIIRFANRFIEYNSAHNNKLKINYFDYFSIVLKTYTEIRLYKIYSPIKNLFKPVKSNTLKL
jgi:hypothetical protein